MSELSKKDQRRLYRRLHDEKHYNRVIKRLNCTLSKREYRHLCSQASKAGLKPTSFAKKAMFAYLHHDYIVPENLEKGLRELILLIRGIGNNLNQLAARSNSFKNTTVFDLVKAKKNLNHLEEIIKSFVRNPPKQKNKNDSEIDEQKDGKFRAVT